VHKYHGIWTYFVRGNRCAKRNETQKRICDKAERLTPLTVMLHVHKEEEVRSSSVSTVTRLRAGRQGFDCRQGQGICFFATASNRFWAHAASYAIGTGVLSPGVKWPGREAGHSPPSGAWFKNL